MTIYTRLVSDKNGQNSSMDMEGAHKVPRLTEELLAVDGFGGRGQFILLRDIALEMLPALQ